MAFKTMTLLLAAVMLLATMITAAPLSQLDIVAREYPQTGGRPGNMWHSDYVTLTWPTHTHQIISNITESMPGWNSAWGFHDDTIDIDSDVRTFGSGIVGHIQNNCPNTMYAHTSIGANAGINNGNGGDDPSDPTATYAIAPGAVYTSAIQAVPNGRGGVSIKISTTPTINPGNVYQIEYCQYANSDGNMAIWYDLSNVNGDPFIGSARYMQVNSNGKACNNIYNAPGSAASDWPAVQGECEAVGDVYFYLC
ncbi:hypothetical protein LTR62_001579 [Meristemomyces frigidus]|uniref:Uncharacterized protein n=1 Tax=Meristemomyces frigidus TaxID=1508187 RepID=A0AAN7TAX5_9PEZI|nr:hypothetical protein LTR62_001579 [Meristemomyces frigidus]